MQNLYGAGKNFLNNISKELTHVKHISTPLRPPKLLDRVQYALRRKHYSYRTEQAYIQWIKRFILFHNKRHPKEMGAPEIEAFLTHLAVEEHVAASTQNQALSALLFLYREVLGQELDISINAVRAKKPKRLPTVLTREEVQRVLAQLSGVHLLMAQLLYGSGLRLMECLRLRVKDLDFEQRQIIVRDGKGQKDRITVLPERLIEPLHQHLQQVTHAHRPLEAQSTDLLQLFVDLLAQLLIIGQAHEILDHVPLTGCTRGEHVQSFCFRHGERAGVQGDLQFGVGLFHHTGTTAGGAVERKEFDVEDAGDAIHGVLHLAGGTRGHASRIGRAGRPRRRRP